jgi:hypothetical protein
MTCFRKVDMDGLFTEDAILDYLPYTENGEPDPLYIVDPVPPDAGFILPRWNFEAKEWEEGGTAPEPVTSEPTLEERNRADIDYLAMMMEVEL